MLSKASVKKPLTVVVGIILVIILGVVSVMNTGVDLLPGMNMPYMMVITVYPGAAPETVEKEVTTPIEKGISTVSNIVRMMSTSSEHVSIVSLELNASANIDSVFQEISSALKLVQFPKNDLLQEPIVMKLNPSMLPIMSLSIGRDNHTIQESGDYFNDIIAQINAIDGVANVTSNGLVSDLAFVGLDPTKTSAYIRDFLFDLLDLDVEVPVETKEALRVYLRDLIKNAETDPDLSTDGKIDPEKLLDRIIYDIENSNVDLGGGEILGQLIEQLKQPNSVPRKAAISAIKSVLANKYMLEDGEENKKIFYSILDQLFASTLTGVAGTLVGDLTNQITADVFKQIIFAQNFDMPAGSLPVGESGYIVKIGDAIKNRDEFYNLPVFTISLTDFLQQYLEQFKAILNVAGLISPDGKATFTDDNLKQIAMALATITENVTDYGQWSVDILTQNASAEFVINQEAKAAWIKLLNDHTGFKTLTESFKEARPTDWRSQTLNYIKNNGLYPIGQVIVAPSFWTDGTVIDGTASLNYNVYYADKLSTQINNMTRFLPTTAQGYATSLVNNLSTNTVSTAFPIDLVGRNAWVETLMANVDFVTLCGTLRPESNWEYILIDYIMTTAKSEMVGGGIATSTVLPLNKTMSLGRDPLVADDDRMWNAFYTGAFVGIGDITANASVFGIKLQAIKDDLPTPTEYKTFGKYVAETLAETNVSSQYYLSTIAIDTWATWLSTNASFISLVDSVTATDGGGTINYSYNWRLKLLQTIQLDIVAGNYTYFPVNNLIRPEQLWDAKTTAYYDGKVVTDIARMDALMVMANSIKAAIGDEAYNSLLKFFDGKNAAQIESDLKSMLEMAAKISPNGVVITKDENGKATYSIDFAALNNDLKNAEERLKLPLVMSSLGNISFLDDSGKQISTIFTRDADGNFISGTSISISIEKEPDKSTANITGDISKLLKNIAKNDPDFKFSVLSDDGSFINQMLSSVLVNLLWGALFAAIVLIFFLKRIKPTLVVASSILISVVAAFVLMYFSGITLNVISMGGMTLAVGMLVDNSIVVLENIYRMKAQGKNLFAASIQGAKQVSSAIVASTITTVVVFLPVIFIDGITKEIMRDMSLTISFALIASLIVALTVVPVAASTILKEKAKPDGKFIKKVKKGYTKVLNFSLNNKIVVIPIVLVLFGSSLLAAFFMNREFMPPMDTGTVVVNCEINKQKIDEINSGIDYFSEEYYTFQDAVNDTIKIVTETTKQYDDVATFGVSYSSGMSLGGMSTGGDPGVSITILLKEKRELGFTEIQEDLSNALKSKTKGLFTFSISTNSLLEIAGMGGNSKEILIYGEDFDELRNETKKITEKLKNIDGVLNVDNGFEDAKKEYKLVVDKKKANALGLTVAQVFLQVQKYLAQPGILETLRLQDPDDLTNSQKDYVDIFVYSENYNVLTWHEGFRNNTDSSPTRIYFTNNLVNKGDKKNNNDYYVLNKSNDSVIIKTDNTENGKIMVIESGGKIPLQCDGDNYTYYVAKPIPKEIDNGDGTTRTETEIVYEQVSYTVRNYLEYSSFRQKPIDLLTLDIKSENMLNPDAAVKTVPLFTLLSDVSFLKDADGNVLYRTNPTVTGELIPQGVVMQDGYSSITHYQKDKCITIKLTYDTTKISDKSLSETISAIIGEYNLDKPTGVRVSTEGTSTMMNEMFSTLILVLLLAIVLIYLIMVAQFQSLKSPFIIMFTIPLAFTGGILLLWITGQKLSIIALIGLIILMGIVVNNGIVFVDYANKLIESGVPKREALLRTGIDRLRPILMTALTTIFATMMMAFDNSSVGKMLQPLAITTIGGLTYATFLTLIFVPIMYEIFNKNAKPSNRTLAFRDAEIDKIDGQEIDDNLTEDVQALIKMVENDTFRLTRAIRKNKHDSIVSEDDFINEIKGENGENGEDNAEGYISPYERQKLKNRGLLGNENERIKASDENTRLYAKDELDEEITADDISTPDDEETPKQ